MANPILQMLGQRQNPQQNNFLQMINQFKQFSQGMTPQKAEEIIKQKLQSGEISQQRFEQLKQQAIQLSKLFK